MKSKFCLLQCISIIMTCTYSYSQEIADKQDTSVNDPETVEMAASNDFDFFASEEPLQMTLCFDIREFLKTKNQPVYVDATLTVKINETNSISQHIKLKARGEMRRTYCVFPPIMLKFKDNDDGTELIQPKGKIKLVTHCDITPTSEKYVLKEYLVYRLYNQLTEYSFKTRLVEVNYIDVNKPEKAFTKYGFLIEDEDQMANRNHAALVSNPNVSLKHMNSSDMLRFAIFNYMIGNTDWSLPGQHNVRVLSSTEIFSGKGIPVVYDFDYSGFVNTGYSTPTQQLPIKSVSERYYLGLCSDDAELNPIMDEFEELKGQFLGTIDNFNYLPEAEKKQVESYINSFYKMYKNRNKLIYELNNTCKTN
jgi:hypothetical protein